jgi:hypothetical protein
VRLLLIGLAIGVIVYVASSGQVIFLPLIFLVPFGWLVRGAQAQPVPQERAATRSTMVRTSGYLSAETE